jgi:hypothetical protein
MAQSLDLPINVGTEMNSYGQKLVDDFDAPELAPVRQAFMDGADFIYGHTALQRLLGLGYLSSGRRSIFLPAAVAMRFTRQWEKVCRPEPLEKRW